MADPPSPQNCRYQRSQSLPQLRRCSPRTKLERALLRQSVDGTLNTATNPVKIGAYIQLYATGEGQTTPPGVDGKLATTQRLPNPSLPVTATVGGLPAAVIYAGAAPTEVAGLMQIDVQIPNGVQPGGYVPVVAQVGNVSTVPGAVWISVSAE